MWLWPGDVIVAQFDAMGNMTFVMCLSGSGVEAAFGIALDDPGNVYVAGGTESADLAVVSPFQSANAGTYDAFVARIDGLVATPTPIGTRISLPFVLK